MSSGLRSKDCAASRPIEVEDTSALCVAKDIVGVEHVGLQVRHIPHRMTCMRLTSTARMCSQKGRHNDVP